MDTTTDDKRDPRLDAPLDALRAAMAHVDAPRGLENELMAAFARRHARKRWYQRVAPLRWATAAGVGSLAALAVVFMLSLHSPARIGTDGLQLVNHDDEAYFIALESLERIEREPNPRMIEAELPGTDLAALGVPVAPEHAGEPVLAEILVSTDGQPLALRLTSPH